MTIQEQLFALQDRDYALFQMRLTPGLTPDRIIGVRMPLLRRMAGQIAGTENAEHFLNDLPHRYYDENNLHALLIIKLKDYDALIHALDQFLPYVDNWATCDTLSPAAFRKRPARLLEDIRRWLSQEDVYTVRFALATLMRFYLDDPFDESILPLAAVSSDRYYVKMMIAWFFATALAKQYDAALPFLTENLLDSWTHNKSISKAIESFRLPDDRKAYLKSLRRPVLKSDIPIDIKK